MTLEQRARLTKHGRLSADPTMWDAIDAALRDADRLTKLEAALNEEKIQQCAIAAYRALGYPVVNFGKGEAPGILRCPPKTIRLMNEFQARLCAALLGEKARGA